MCSFKQPWGGQAIQQGTVAKATWSDYVKCSFKQVQEKYEFSFSCMYKLHFVPSEKGSTPYMKFGVNHILHVYKRWTLWSPVVKSQVEYLGWYFFVLFCFLTEKWGFDC